MARAEGRADETLSRLLSLRQQMIEALRDYATHVDLALLGDLCRDTLEQMASLHAETRGRHRNA